jgi:N utilization substance protein A
MKLADASGIGIKKARQIRAAAENYLVEEARLREELNLERTRLGEPIPPRRGSAPPAAPGSQELAQAPQAPPAETKPA